MKPKITLIEKANNVFKVRANVETEIFHILYTLENKEEFEKNLLKFLKPAYYIGKGYPWKVEIYEESISLSGWKDLRNFKKGTYITRDAIEFKCVLT